MPTSDASPTLDQYFRTAWARTALRGRAAHACDQRVGCRGNPALAPLYLRTAATDVIVVGINPIVRATVPRTARGIIDRIDEISFNSTFMLELAAIAFVEDLVKAAPAQAHYRPLFMHGIGDDQLGSFGASSKMNNDPAFLRHLHGTGWQCADRLLAENLQAIGQSSTLDLEGLVQPERVR